MINLFVYLFSKKCGKFQVSSFFFLQCELNHNSMGYSFALIKILMANKLPHWIFIMGEKKAFVGSLF